MAKEELEPSQAGRLLLMWAWKAQKLVELAKKEERERILGILKKEYPAIDTWPCWQTLKEDPK